MSLNSVTSEQRERFVNGLMTSGRTSYELAVENGMTPSTGFCIARGVLGKELFARREEKAEDNLGQRLADLIEAGSGVAQAMDRLKLSRYYGYKIYNRWKKAQGNTLTDLGNGIYVLGEEKDSRTGGELTLSAGSTPVQAVSGEVTVRASDTVNTGELQEKENTCTVMTGITVTFMNAEIRYTTALSPEKSVAEIMKNMTGGQ